MKCGRHEITYSRCSWIGSLSARQRRKGLATSMNRSGFDEEGSVNRKIENLTFRANNVFFSLFFLKSSLDWIFYSSLRDQLVSDVPKRAAIFITKGICSFPAAAPPPSCQHWLVRVLFPAENSKHRHYFPSHIYSCCTPTPQKSSLSVFLHGSPFSLHLPSCSFTVWAAASSTSSPSQVLFTSTTWLWCSERPNWLRCCGETPCTKTGAENAAVIPRNFHS